MTRMVHTKTPPRSLPFTTCQPQRHPLNCRSSLAWSHTCLPLCPLCSFTTPLHGLLKKDAEFTWNETYQDAFDSVKSLVCSNTTLCYFDVCRPVTIKVNASMKGPWSCPPCRMDALFAFASKVLTPTEQCYANIEHELLACVFGAEQFCTYVFSCKFTATTNPLSKIMLKNLADAPAHLQRMFVMPLGLWHSHQILTWQRHAHSRCLILLCPTFCPCNTSQHLCEPSPHHTTEEELISRMLCAVTQPSMP